MSISATSTHESQKGAYARRFTAAFRWAKNNGLNSAAFGAVTNPGTKVKLLANIAALRDALSTHATDRNRWRRLYFLVNDEDASLITDADVEAARAAGGDKADAFIARFTPGLTNPTDLNFSSEDF